MLFPAFSDRFRAFCKNTLRFICSNFSAEFLRRRKLDRTVSYLPNFRPAVQGLPKNLAGLKSQHKQNFGPSKNKMSITTRVMKL